jgi:hypothetical protein
MLDDIDDFGDNEEEDDDDEKKKKKKIYHKCQSKVRKPTIHVDFKLSIFLCNNMTIQSQPRAIQNRIILFDSV